MAAQRVLGGEHTGADWAGCLLPVQLHVVRQALPPAERLAAVGAGEAAPGARRRPVCEGTPRLK